MSRPVFRADPGTLGAAAPGAEVVVTGPEARHALTVRRLGAGDGLELVDGHGLRAAGTVTGAERERMTVRVDAVAAEPVRTPRLVLAQALAKGERDLLAVETATELGADAVVPWQAERSIVRWRRERAAKSHEKWVHTVAAAAKQSRRAAWPEVAPLASTEDLAGRAARPGTLALVLHEDAERALVELLAPAPGTPDEVLAGAEEVLLVVGPEGGIAPAELERLGDAGALPVRLGREVLRSSTAGPAALAVLAALLGRWAGGDA
ncbi:rRNA methyltransferase [Kocuria flava]|uniref:Ribosomal RNA small subunit methyltransferase E n=1 Tax=Kocuria flava TaxID=446860 RepID=A0A2N4T3D5_9MICC|nr:16S rRNA (uracil(1498)-N(3))-methyltransferase [Kocuria flava]PLC12706.1 rRNA methyltransferase [Kocuria flava]